MKTIASLLACAIWLLATQTTAVAYDLFFDAPKKDDCLADGVRQWSAIIDGRGYYGDWVAACQTTSAEIEGNSYSALNCGWQADSRVWGQFRVPDPSCKLLWWMAPKKDWCLAGGLRQWSAIITGSTLYTGNWFDACRETPANIAGSLRNSVRCSLQADSRVWGEFDVPDPSCRHTRVRGRLLYRDFASTFDSAGNYTSITDRPIRRVLVEIWFGPAGSRQKQVTYTGNDGSIDVDVPSDADPSTYRAVVIASNEAGQVNWADNTATWYSTPELTLQTHPEGDGLLLGDLTGLIFQDPHTDAMSFNALDSLLVARDYATSHGIPKDRIYPVAIIPTIDGEFTSHTTASGLWSLIWVPFSYNNDTNYMFDDQGILHEYAHHLERMNDTYALWPTVHTGCDAKGADFAWFEGFPDYFSFVAGRGSTKPLNGIAVWPAHYPAGAKPPSGTAASLPCSVNPEEVEDYLASLLLELVNQTISSGGGGAPMSQDQLETKVLSLWFDKMEGARLPGGRLPTVYDFAGVWNNEFPASGALRSLMKVYGMK